jgi:hypothetical protein
MDKVRTFLFEHWKGILTYFTVSGGLGFLLIYKIASITPGASDREVDTIASSASVHQLFLNPLFLPYRLLQYFAVKLPIEPLFAARIVSGVFALVCIWLFYHIIKAWYSPRVALMATVLFSSSSWFLHAARYASPLIMFTAILAVLWCGLLLRTHPSKFWALCIVIILVGITCYIPGFLWFTLIALVWQRKQALQTFRGLSVRSRVSAILLSIVTIAPLLAGLIKSPQLIKPLLSVPAKVPALTTLWQNFINIPLHLFYHGPEDPHIWVAGTPLIDFFCLVMLALGLYALRFNFSLHRIRTLVGLLVISTLLIIIGSADILILLPLVYVGIASGMAFMLQQWFTVFPRNPVARGLAAGIITLAIGLSCFYQLQHYFVAWRYRPETKAAFTGQDISNLLQ